MEEDWEQRANEGRNLEWLNDDFNKRAWKIVGRWYSRNIGFVVAKLIYNNSSILFTWLIKNLNFFYKNSSKTSQRFHEVLHKVRKPLKSQKFSPQSTARSDEVYTSYTK